MPLKEAVLKTLQCAEKPLGAYAILAQIQPQKKKLAPTTIYRALSALVDEGQAHRIESMNAFICCRSERCREHPQQTAVFSICDDCGAVTEQVDPAVSRDLSVLATRIGFSATRHVIEIHGCCRMCQIEDGRSEDRRSEDRRSGDRRSGDRQ
jgi:Fur family zinc uptake transcriptional regulator